MSFDQLKRTGQRVLRDATASTSTAPIRASGSRSSRTSSCVLVGLTGGGLVRGTLRNIGVSTFRDQRRDDARPGVPRRRDAAVGVRGAPGRAGVPPGPEHAAAVREQRRSRRCGGSTCRSTPTTSTRRTMLDARLVLSFDAFYDAAARDRRAGRAAARAATRAAPPRCGCYAPDELFFLRNQGEGEIAVRGERLPLLPARPRADRGTLRATGTARWRAGSSIRLTGARERDRSHARRRRHARRHGRRGARSRRWSATPSPATGRSPSGRTTTRARRTGRATSTWRVCRTSRSSRSTTSTYR